MPQKRKVEIFTADCPVCREVLSRIEAAACCEGCETEIVNTQESVGAQRAKELGISRLPAIAIDGELLSCCATSSVDLEKLKQACL